MAAMPSSFDGGAEEGAGPEGSCFLGRWRPEDLKYDELAALAALANAHALPVAQGSPGPFRSGSSHHLRVRWQRRT